MLPTRYLFKKKLTGVECLSKKLSGHLNSIAVSDSLKKGGPAGNQETPLIC